MTALSVGQQFQKDGALAVAALLHGLTCSFEDCQDIVPVDITILDIDNESAFIFLSGDTLNVQVDATDLGDNSAQTIDLQGLGAFHTLEANFSSSGAVAELEWDFTISVEEDSWGRIKNRYRD